MRHIYRTLKHIGKGPTGTSGTANSTVRANGIK
jgi:hypothetical protein